MTQSTVSIQGFTYANDLCDTSNCLTLGVHLNPWVTQA